MEFLEPVLYIGISQTFFAGLLIATQKPVTTANRLIAALMFMLFFDLLFALVKIKFILFYSFPFIAFTYGPLLYFYIRAMTIPGFRFSLFNLFHFVPFIVFFIISVLFRSDKTFADLQGYFVADKYISVRIVYSISFFLSISIYSILAFVNISRHQKKLRDEISYTSNVITLNWLKIISITFYISYIVLFILGGIELFLNVIPFDPYYSIFLFVALFSFIYSFYAIRQPGLIGIIFKAETGESDQEPVKSYSRSGLKEGDAEKILVKLLAYMDDKKPYLDRDLTIYDLSVAVDIPRHHITQVLNENYGKNFFTFINEYRIKEFIRRTEDPKYRNYTVLAIAYDSGFNSKSTFNSIFKTITGKTPSQYRQSSGTD